MVLPGQSAAAVVDWDGGYTVDFPGHRVGFSSLEELEPHRGTPSPDTVILLYFNNGASLLEAYFRLRLLHGELLFRRGEDQNARLQELVAVG